MSHREMIDKIVDTLSPLVAVIRTEYQLPNGKVADVLIDTIGGRIIIEVKPIVTYAYLQAAYGKYASECNGLFLASPREVYHEHEMAGLLGWPQERIKEVGVIAVTWFGLAILRPAAYRLLP